MNAPPPLIRLVDVTKTYVTGEVAVEVLHGVSLEIVEGEFVAIMGASGSGKTTLMNILGCLDRPSSGRYLFEGQDVARLSADDVARLRRDAIGFVFQSYNLIASANATENVEVPATYAGMKSAERRRRAEALLDMLGLGERLTHRPNQLSGGQQQRVAVARALMNGARVIFADEPTGALDSRSGEEVMALLRRLNDEGHTVVLITHDRHVAEHANRLIEIRDGMIVGDSTRMPATPVGVSAAGAGQGRREDTATVLLSETVEAVRTALRSLRANVFRTVLMLLGIIIGVGSVVAMLAVGEGASRAVLDQIGAMGTNLVLIRPGAPNMRGSGGITTLVPADAEAIAALPNVVAAVGDRSSGTTLRFGNADYQSQVTAIGADLPLIRDWPVERGLFFDEADIEAFAPVVVLGKTAAESVFPTGEDPVGHYLLLNNVPFQVIGVMAPKGATPYGADMDDVAFVPLSTGMLRLFGDRHLRTVTVMVDDVGEIDATEAAIRDLLIQRHGVEDFRIRNMASILETASETQGALTVLLGSIAAISLLVGGIGVMNMMLVSVTERTREIGIRMATGARRANILQQFLIEAVVISALGGVVGAAGGLAVAWFLRFLDTPIVFSALPVVLAFGCAFATGLIFGFMPARKAAGLDPVVALSAE